MDEIFEICDQISVLRDGSLVMTKDSKDTDMNELISSILCDMYINEIPCSFNCLIILNNFSTSGALREVL